MDNSQRIAIFLPSLAGGGAERAMCNLAVELARRTIHVDLVLASKMGHYLKDVPPTVRLVDLRSSRIILSLTPLARYLKTEKPSCLISALSHANVIAISSHFLARSAATLIVSEQLIPTGLSHSSSLLDRFFLPVLMRLLYKRPNRIVAPSRGVADELVTNLGVQRDQIAIIYNPIVNDELFQKANEQIDHPWFRPDAPPVILGAGRLTKQKDFQTLIRAFSIVRKSREVHLMILGEGEDQSELRQLAQQLGIAKDLSLPGFADNPYKYMRAARVFVLSSIFEGFGNVVVEAMACGTPVVCTNCRSGPSEILEDGRWGRLTTVGDISALAEAISSTLNDVSHPDVRSRAAMFPVEKAATEYLAAARTPSTSMLRQPPSTATGL